HRQLVPELGHPDHDRRARPGRRPDLLAGVPAGGSAVTGAPVAVITGAASGIGAACARLLGDRGWRTAGIDLNDSGCDLSATLDVTDRDGVRGAVDAAAAEFGRIDLAVTAAGYYQEGIAAI